MVEREGREGSLSRSETMGATERMLDQVFNLKFLSKQLVRQVSMVYFLGLWNEESTVIEVFWIQ